MRALTTATLVVMHACMRYAFSPCTYARVYRSARGVCY